VKSLYLSHKCAVITPILKRTAPGKRRSGAADAGTSKSDAENGRQQACCRICSIRTSSFSRPSRRMRDSSRSLGASGGFRPLGGLIHAFCSHLRKRLTRLLKDRIDLQKPSQAGQDLIAINGIELDPVADPTGLRVVVSATRLA
jgi:hypothetical protein